MAAQSEKMKNARRIRSIMFELKVDICSNLLHGTKCLNS